MSTAEPPNEEVASSDADQPPEDGPSGLSGAAHLAAWGFVFLILRIFAVADYNWETAFLVSTTLGLDDGLALLFGSLMAGHVLTSVLLILVVPLLVAAYVWGPRQHRPIAMLLTTVGLITLAALTVSFRSWWLPLVTGAVFAAIVLTGRMAHDSRLRRALISTLGRVGWVAGVSALVVAAVVPTPWVPLEEIETEHGTVSGHVLSIDSGYLNVLTDEQEFIIILSSEVRSRR